MSREIGEVTSRILDYVMVTTALVVGFSWAVDLLTYDEADFAGFATMLLGRIL